MMFAVVMSSRPQAVSRHMAISDLRARKFSQIAMFLDTLASLAARNDQFLNEGDGS